MGRRGNKWNYIKSITISFGDSIVVIPLDKNEKIRDRKLAKKDLQMMGQKIKTGLSSEQRPAEPIQQPEKLIQDDFPEIDLFDLDSMIQESSDIWGDGVDYFDLEMNF